MTTLLTTTQAAKKLGVTPQRLRKLRDDGRIRAVAIGPLWLYEPAEIKRFAKIKRPSGRPKSKPAKDLKNSEKSA